MKVAFYKGKSRIFNRLVSWWTRGPYSHAEIVFPNGISYSSSHRDGGVRFKHIRFDERIWDFVQLDTSISESDVHANMRPMMGYKFDTRGLFGFVWRRMPHTKNRVFCSEFVMQCLGYYESWRFDPNTAYSVLKTRKK